MAAILLLEQNPRVGPASDPARLTALALAQFDRVSRAVCLKPPSRVHAQRVLPTTPTGRHCDALWCAGTADSVTGHRIEPGRGGRMATGRRPTELVAAEHRTRAQAYHLLPSVRGDLLASSAATASA